MKVIYSTPIRLSSERKEVEAKTITFDGLGMSIIETNEGEKIYVDIRLLEKISE